MPNLPQENIWTASDAEADVLYINFQLPPLAADDSKLTDDNIIVRYKDNQIIGLTILNASHESLP